MQKSEQEHQFGVDLQHPKWDVSWEEEEGRILNLLTAKPVQPVGVMDCWNGMEERLLEMCSGLTEADVS